MLDLHCLMRLTYFKNMTCFCGVVAAHAVIDIAYIIIQTEGKMLSGRSFMAQEFSYAFY